MSQVPPGGQPVVEVKPQPNIYSVMLVIAILVLAVTIGLVMHNLMASWEDGSGYGLSVGELFQPLDTGEAEGGGGAGSRRPGR
jgi:hypothetical protein